MLSEVNLEKFCMLISIQKKGNASLLGDNFPKKRMEIFLIKTKTPKGNECFNSLVHQGVDYYLKMYIILSCCSITSIVSNKMKTYNYEKCFAISYTWFKYVKNVTIKFCNNTPMLYL